MKQAWTGIYSTNDNGLTVATNIDSITFNLKVNSFKDGEFTGTIDDQIFHLKDHFAIQGSLQGSTITFVKFKAVGQDAGEILSVVQVDKSGPIIKYKGVSNKDGTAYSGTWKFKTQFIKLLGFIPFPHTRAKGTWYMEVSKDN